MVLEQLCELDYVITDGTSYYRLCYNPVTYDVCMYATDAEGDALEYAASVMLYKLFSGSSNNDEAVTYSFSVDESGTLSMTATNAVDTTFNLAEQFDGATGLDLAFEGLQGTLMLQSLEGESDLTGDENALIDTATEAVTEAVTEAETEAETEAIATEAEIVEETVAAAVDDVEATHTDLVEATEAVTAVAATETDDNTSCSLMLILFLVALVLFLTAGAVAALFFLKLRKSKEQSTQQDETISKLREQNEAYAQQKRDQSVLDQKQNSQYNQRQADLRDEKQQAEDACRRAEGMAAKLDEQIHQMEADSQAKSKDWEAQLRQEQEKYQQLSTENQKLMEQLQAEKDLNNRFM